MFGREAAEKFAAAKVCVFGAGAVGGFAIEALARTGVGRFKIVDFDVIDKTNINRQLLALESSVGDKKCELAKKRIADINAAAEVDACAVFIDQNNIAELFDCGADVYIDAIDTLSSKIDLIEYALRNAKPLVSSMGAARRKDPSKVAVADLFKSFNCPLAAKIRKELRHRGIKAKGCPCVFSSEVSAEETHLQSGSLGQKKVIGSSAILTGIFGLNLANLALKKIAGESWRE